MYQHPFHSCREFASGGRTPDHDDAGVTHHQAVSASLVPITSAIMVVVFSIGRGS